MLALGATEYPHWRHAEYTYQTGDKTKKLIEVRNDLIKGNPRLELFFKTEEEIRKYQ
jgi:hypothetical protein